MIDFRAIADAICKTTRHRWVGIYEITESSVRNIAYSGDAPPEYPVFPRDRGLTGEMLRRNETVVSGDVSADPNYLTAFATTQSEMIVPLRSRRGAIIGTLDVESDVPNAFGERQREAIEAFARVLEPLFWQRGRAFEGFDHVDTRVSSVAAVESFYDALMPVLGLPRKRYAFVDGSGNWQTVATGERYNAIEYYEESVAAQAPRFVGFIEEAGMAPLKTRIAFRLRSADRVEPFAEFLRGIGAKNVELSADMQTYPAVFFEDPAGTRLELCARPAT